MLHIFPINPKFETREKNNNKKPDIRYLWTDGINVFLRNSFIFSLYRIADALSKADNCLMFPSKTPDEKPKEKSLQKPEEKSGDKPDQKPEEKSGEKLDKKPDKKLKKNPDQNPDERKKENREKDKKI